MPLSNEPDEFADPTGAKHVALVPPPEQVQVQGLAPPPETELGEPTPHKFVCGAMLIACPLELPHEA
jgi:hypothetical protein